MTEEIRAKLGRRGEQESFYGDLSVWRLHDLCDLFDKYKALIKKYAQHEEKCPAPVCSDEDYVCECDFDADMKAAGFVVGPGTDEYLRIR